MVYIEKEYGMGKMTENRRFKPLILAIHDYQAPLQGYTYDLTKQGEVNALCNLINGLNNKSYRLENENEHSKNKNKILEPHYQKLESTILNLQLDYNDLKNENVNLSMWFNSIRSKYERLKAENKRLRQLNDYFETTYAIEEQGLNAVSEMCTVASSYTPSRQQLFEENEQLKQQNQRVFDCIDKYIDECKQELTETATKTEIHRLEFMIHSLKNLKKELKISKRS